MSIFGSDTKWLHAGMSCAFGGHRASARGFYILGEKDVDQYGVAGYTVALASVSGSGRNGIEASLSFLVPRLPWPRFRGRVETPPAAASATVFGCPGLGFGVGSKPTNVFRHFADRLVALASVSGSGRNGWILTGPTAPSKLPWPRFRGRVET